MKRPCRQPAPPAALVKSLVHAALLAMVVMVVGHVHSHRCLDGQEPALTVHFEAFNGHPEHTGDENHEDRESEMVPQGLPGKAPDQEAPLFLTADSALFSFQRLQETADSCWTDECLFPPAESLLPSPRAPPADSRNA